MIWFQNRIFRLGCTVATELQCFQVCHKGRLLKTAIEVLSRLLTSLEFIRIKFWGKQRLKRSFTIVWGVLNLLKISTVYTWGKHNVVHTGNNLELID